VAEIIIIVIKTEVAEAVEPAHPVSIIMETMVVLEDLEYQL
jgi:hypothetical protein